MQPSTKATPVSPDSRPRPARLLQSKPLDESVYNAPGSAWFKVEDRVFSAGEVESVIESDPSVAEAAVVFRNHYLTAFFTTIATPKPHFRARIEAAIREQLPPHQWPKRLVRVYQIPMKDGQVDRNRLSRLRANLKRRHIKIPRIVDAVNSWAFEGIIESIPSATTLLVSHYPHIDSDGRRPIKVIIHRTKLPIHTRLGAGWYGIFEGYFGRGGAMLATKVTASYTRPRSALLSSPEKALAAF